MKLRAAAFLLVACTGANANGADNMLRAASEDQRRLVLARMLAASGERCGDVIDTYRQGLTRKDEAVWNVRCANGRAIAIIIIARRRR